MSEATASKTAARLAEIREAMEKAAREAGRDASGIELVAVSKRFGIEKIEEAIRAGQKVFGENRVQEARAKGPELHQRHEGLELHLIGPLQSNKAADAVALFDVIHTIDREKIARAIRREMDKQNRNPQLFVQVNTGEEPQKAGVAPEETEDFVDFCIHELGLPITGLMCIPPWDEEPAMHFALLKKYADELGFENLSMGMSGDFETAIALGATHIRVGTAIFGPRNYGGDQGSDQAVLRK
jgi:pyridoxal phosphate enzyme (YggS family)